MAIKNDFHNDLDFSLDASNEQFIDCAYKHLFPHIIEIQKVNDLKLQKQGIDKILITDSGKTILIDEKIRRRWYGDILLEEYSDFDNKIVGWLNKTKYTDYIAYIVIPAKVLYLLPFLLLQKVWLKNYHRWLEEYGRKFAINKTWKTSNIPIPINILLNEIKDSMKNTLDIDNPNITTEPQQLEFSLAGGQMLRTEIYKMLIELSSEQIKEFAITAFWKMEKKKIVDAIFAVATDEEINEALSKISIKDR